MALFIYPAYILFAVLLVLKLLIRATMLEVSDVIGFAALLASLFSCVFAGVSAFVFTGLMLFKAGFLSEFNCFDNGLETVLLPLSGFFALIFSVNFS